MDTKELEEKVAVLKTEAAYLRGRVTALANRRPVVVEVYRAHRYNDNGKIEKGWLSSFTTKFHWTSYERDSECALRELLADTARELGLPYASLQAHISANIVVER